MSLLGFFKKMSAPDPTAQLKQEHDRFRALLEQAQKTTERSALRRKKIFAEFSALLALHETVEERVLYAALKKHAKTEPIVQEGFQEHHLADLLMAELKTMAVTDADWGAKFHVMGEGVEHHLKEEEDDMFPLVKRVLSEKQLAQIVERMAKIRNAPTIPRRTPKGSRPSSMPPTKATKASRTRAKSSAKIAAKSARKSA